MTLRLQSTDFPSIAHKHQLPLLFFATYRPFQQLWQMQVRFSPMPEMTIYDEASGTFNHLQINGTVPGVLTFLSAMFMQE
jgi:hypothetical protein